MRIDIRFNHLDRSEALEQYALEKITDAVDSSLHAHDGHVLIWLINEVSRVQKGVPQYKCEIEVRFPPKKNIFVSKTAEEMHAAILEAADAVQLLLREDNKRTVNTRNDPRNTPIGPTDTAENE